MVKGRAPTIYNRDRCASKKNTYRYSNKEEKNKERLNEKETKACDEKAYLTQLETLVL